MRTAEEARPEVDGKEISCIPGNACQIQKRNRKNNESSTVVLKKILLADGTTIRSPKENMNKQDNKEGDEALRREKENTKEEEGRRAQDSVGRQGRIVDTVVESSIR